MREIQFTNKIVFIASLGIQLWWIVTTAMHTEYYYDLVLLPFATFISIFFVNSILHNVLAFIIPGDWLKRNSLYYTAHYNKQYDSGKYPSLTIIIPVYKESFAATIRPTLEQAIEACEQYENSSMSAANLLVCDDGMELIEDEEQIERRQFYDANRRWLTWVARPAAGRRGRFKKAGNINFALCRPGLQIGEVLLILDCDSRIPISGLHIATKEFNNSKVAILQLATIAMLSSRPSVWEKMVAHFTNNIYEVSFLTITANGDPAPFVGHNAFLRRSAIEKVVRYVHIYKHRNPVIDNGIIYEREETEIIPQLFSEEHVSEDFELSIRLQDAGFICRYLTHIDTYKFQEGVTLNPIDEIVRLQKYAYGVSELLIYPVHQWCSHGVLSPTIKLYLLSPNISTTTKYNVLGYMGTYYAVAIAPIIVTIHYFAFFYCKYWRNIIVNSEDVLFGCISVFTILTPLATICLKLKLGRPLQVIKEFLCTISFGLFFSGIGLHLLYAIICHLLNLSVSWSSTNKEATGYKEYIKQALKFWPVYLICTGQLTIIGVGWFVLGFRSWSAITPMAISAGAHLLVPFMK
jgi:cellulose synthase/poly-beta-1,6-N-acetylglucosamine synthase-like glycosyltransferase